MLMNRDLKCLRRGRGAVSVYRSAGEQAAACDGAVIGGVQRCERQHCTGDDHQRREPAMLDIEIENKKAGLSAPLKVRMKLFTLDNRLILNQVGAMAKNDRGAIDVSLMRLLSKR